MVKIIIVGSIIEQNDKILMVQENEYPYKGMWSLPTGHKNKNETIKNGIIRETKEETGLDIKIKGLLPIYVTDTKIIYRAAAKIIGGKIEADGYEINDVEYMTLDEILSLKEDQLRCYKQARQALMDYKNGKIYKLPPIIKIEEKQKVYTR